MFCVGTVVVVAAKGISVASDTEDIIQKYFRDATER
jgi:hypothetical protein